jgi:putative PIN family toxin of toxin-antitoxin system
VRAVLDVNVLISGIIARGTPARILEAWRSGSFELVVSPMLLDELAGTLRNPKLAGRVTPGDATAFVQLLERASTVSADPPDRPPRSRDPGDDYLLALAESARALLVSGDVDLLELRSEFPVRSPQEFLAELGF